LSQVAATSSFGNQQMSGGVPNIVSHMSGGSGSATMMPTPLVPSIQHQQHHPHMPQQQHQQVRVCISNGCILQFILGWYAATLWRTSAAAATCKW
jgi:hypothetical protein